MLVALVLICSSAVAELRDCTRENAADVMKVPGEYGLPTLCFMRGQAFLAETSIAQDLREGDRVRIVCQKADRGPR
jgi:hypothetical protein